MKLGLIFIGGFLIGFFIGFFLMACLVVGKDDENS